MRQGFTKRRLISALTVGALVTLGFGVYNLVAGGIAPIFMVAGSVGSLLSFSLATYIGLGNSSRFT